MKQIEIFLKIFMMTTCLFYSDVINAYDFEVDGIYYNKISTNEVEVTYKSSTDRGYTGEITIPGTVTYKDKGYTVSSIGNSAFYECRGLTGSLTIPNTVTSIGEYAFFRCTGFTGALTIPNSVIQIGEGAFYQCTGFNGALTLPNSITSIGDAVFYECKGLTGSLIIPNTITSIGSGAFIYCSGFTGSLTIPTSVITIKNDAFRECSGFTGSLTIPNSVESIGMYAFYKCSGFTESITLPNSVTSIEDYAFAGLSMIPKVVSLIQSPFNISNTVFSGISSNAILQIPTGTKTKYQEISGWTTNFKEIIEESPTYNLFIEAIGNGVVTYDGTAIRGKTSSFTIIEGTNATITFSPDNGYQIKSVKVNNTDVTSSVLNNSYTISNISDDTTVEVEFEAIPPTTYTLSIKATGNGSATYDGTAVKGKTSRFTVVEGTNATISFSPDDGYRIKSVKVNSTDVTSSVSNNKYTVSNISKDTSLEVEFEAIPPTTYTLSVKATGNGTATYDGTSIRGKTSTFTVVKGTNATISFTPDDGYRIKSVKVNSTDVTSSVSNNKYTVSSISKDTSVEVEFEAIPPTTYTLSIKATDNGSATYDGTSVRGKTSSFTVVKGTNATISFTPDDAYRIKSVKVNSTDVTSSVSNNKYTISNISKDTSVEVDFEAIPPTTYTLSIKATGNGTATYDGTSVRGKSSSFTVVKGTNATITFTPDDGYRIKNVKVNSTDVTSSVSNNKYTVSSISKDTSVEVEFEAIPPTTYTLSIKATGNGTATYDGTSVRGKTSSFTVVKGTNATITFTPDDGYRIKSVKVNSTDVTSSVSRNSYTISSISKDTSVEVEFEVIPLTTYTLSIKATGNGTATYDGTSVRGKTSTFTVVKGTNATISFTPDDGYRIKSVKVNSTDVTSSVSNNKYTVSSISKDVSVEVDFEAIPPTTYTLSITASGYGSVLYDGTSIRNRTSSFTVTEGTSATISFSPDDGYRIKNVWLNNSAVSVSNNRYTISSISRNTTLEVEFEAIPPTTYTLSITASGYGSASYDGTTVRNRTSSFTVTEGTSATIIFNPDNDYRIKSVRVDNSTVSVSNNQYTISSINSNTTVSVEFEAIPTTTYTLTITSTGCGYAYYDGNNIRNRTSTFSVNEGSNATISFFSDDGRINSVKVGMLGVYNDVTSSLSNNSYTINNIRYSISVIVEFGEELKTFESDGINYSVSSYDDKTIIVGNGDYGQVLEVPAEVTYQNSKWKVIGIDNDALAGNTKLAAIIWNPATEFTLNVSNPNLLLYVTSANYAPASITNVIVSNTASKIVLTDATSGNDFYCPREFTAKSISYTHNYGMMTGKGESRGWETIALPFDVEKITHSSKGEITPFANWKNEDRKKPFWLMTYGTGGWTEANSIKANTPYIISLPNHSDYKSDFRLSGSITFSAENITVKKTDNLQTGSYNGKTLRPNFTNEDNNGCYALNVNNDYVAYNGGANEGSTFVLNLRPVRPFEAYMTTTSNFARSIAISDDMTTGIKEVMSLLNEHEVVRVYNLQGQQLSVEAGKNVEDVKRLLPAGIYIINGKKQIIR